MKKNSIITTKGDVKAMRYKLKTSLMSMLMLCIFVITLLPFQNTFAYNNTATNLTQSTNVTVSKSIEEGLALGVIDGDVQSANKATQNAKGAWTYYGKNEQWICIDLGNIYCIDEIKAYFGYAENGSQRPESFRMYYSADGKNYKTLASENEGYNYNYTKALTDSVWARFIKLTIDAALQNRVVRVREIEVYGAGTPIVNVTQSDAVKVINATAGQNNAMGIIDGDTTKADGGKAWTYWKTGSATIDLGVVCSIKYINGYFGYSDGNFKPNGFTIELSKTGNDDDWIKFAEEDQSKAAYAHNYTKIADDETEARYVRLTINSLLNVADTHFRVREIEVYGIVNAFYFTKTENTDGSATYTISNNTNNLEHVAIIKATYNDKALANVTLEEIKDFAPYTTHSLTGQAGERVFIWDGISTMKPVLER